MIGVNWQRGEKRKEKKIQRRKQSTVNDGLSRGNVMSDFFLFKAINEIWSLDQTAWYFPMFRVV